MSLTHYFSNDYSTPFDRFFDDVLSSRAYRQSQQGDIHRPRTQLNTLLDRLDIHHDDKSNAVTATFELPGLRKEDVSIDVRNNVLTVSGETKETTQHTEEGYSLRERRHGKFSRSLSLPQGVKNEDITANMDNGVLNVTFPKSAPETAPARITIS
ncbi:small heat shock protein [Russula dissimulans]|nr:small heat shock protein [Russula dissimulans]